MLSTLPTLTPAILTSESGRRLLALEKIAWTVNGVANGFANLVNARYVSNTIATIPIEPAVNRLTPRRLRPRFIICDRVSLSATAFHGFAGLGRKLWSRRRVAAECLTRRDVCAAVESRTLITGRVGIDREVAPLRVELVELLRPPSLAGLAVRTALTVDRGTV